MSGGWFKMYPSDFLNGVSGLSPNELAVYTVVLMRMYDEDGPIVDEPERIARRCNMRLPTCKKAIHSLIDSGKLVRESGHLANPRAQKEIGKRHETNTKQASNAHKRWQEKSEKSNENNDGEMPPHDSGMPSAMPYQIPDTRYQNNTVPSGTGDPADDLWSVGVKYLMASGRKESHCRSVIGKWRKVHSDAEILAAIVDAQRQGVVDPLSYLEKILQPKPASRLSESIL